EKRSATGREPYTLDFAETSAAHALVHSVVFAIDRQQWLVLLASFSRDQLSRRDQAFFVRQAYCFACPPGFVSCFESGNAHNRADYKVNFWMSGYTYRACLAVNDFNPTQPFSLKLLANFIGILLRRQRENYRLPAARIVERSFHV